MTGRLFLFRRLLPKETDFFDYFEQHSKLTVEACKEFQALTSKGADLAARASRIKDIEHEADDLTHRCIESLHKTFITPFDRGDIHSLIKRLDDIIDSVDAVASRMVLYDIKDMRAEAQALADVLVRASAELEQAVRHLRHLKFSDLVKEKCIAIHNLENEGDTILRSALARLFAEERDAALIIKWKELYERLERATDRCEEVANILEGVLLEAT
jgi:predicted phosphate transport protein (TIGR00153 family)